MTAKTAPYGSWRSPLTARQLAGDTLSFGHLAFDGDTPHWSESRPREGGRQTLMRWHVGRAEEILPAPWSARTRAHEYGGGAFAVAQGVVYFTHNVDQRIYALRPGDTPRALTPESPARYADLLVDVRRQRLIAVTETLAGDHEPKAAMVAVPLAGGVPVALVEGEDFYSSPVLSADGRSLAWLSWNHPAMPWDGTRLWLADLDAAGRPQGARCIAGGEQDSVFEPQFGSDGTLYFASDCSGWWNLYGYRDGRTAPLCPRAAEFGLPQWQFGMSTFAIVGQDLVCAYSERGQWSLARLETASGRFTPYSLPFTEFSAVRAAGRQAVFVAASPRQMPVLVQLDLDTGRFAVIRESAAALLADEDISVAEAVSYPVSGGGEVHGFFYPPRNHGYRAPDGEAAIGPSLARGPCLDPIGERPPLLVLSHGGPTAATGSGFNPRIQYFTTRGFAVLDVNYRGSTGYGRAYREQLDGQWGVADVEDCVAGARWLAAQGRVDGKRMVIRGSSAGGYTTLCALTFHDCFAAGASYYGISDLEALARDTHKFEKHYLDRLVGTWPAEAVRYRERSPIHYTGRLRTPVIFFQGREDKVVPPDQTERLAAALRQRGIAVATVMFDNEAHGFRRAENIERALEAEYYFYSQVLGFTPAENLPVVPIDNRRDAGHPA